MKKILEENKTGRDMMMSQEDENTKLQNMLMSQEDENTKLQNMLMAQIDEKIVCIDFDIYERMITDKELRDNSDLTVKEEKEAVFSNYGLSGYQQKESRNVIPSRAARSPNKISL